MTFITSHLALGGANDPVRFADHIDAVLCCASEVPLYPNKPGQHIKLEDGVPIEAFALGNAFRFLDTQIAKGHTTLVYCGHGTSRSVSVLCGYLALKQKTSPRQILELAKRLRPSAHPSVVTFKSVERYVGGLNRPEDPGECC